MPETPDTLARRFVPASLDPAEWDQIEPLFDELAARELDSAEALEAWLMDLSELMAVLAEYGSRRRIERACDTEDEQIERAFLHYVEQIAPKIKPHFFALQHKALQSPFTQQLEGERWDVLRRHWQAEVELFRQENVPLQTELTKLASEYDKLHGAMEVTFQGQRYTLAQLGRFMEEPDRPVREQTWRLAAERRLADRERIDAIFDQMLQTRQQVATNAGKANYRDYIWQSYARFDYTPDDCLEFANAIEQVCLPLVRELDARRKAALRVDRLRPWDLAVDETDRPPLTPFPPDDPEVLRQRTQAVFERISPELAQTFSRLKPGRNLDLESRRGKRGGGFQAALQESGEPFIFMNAAGVHRDVETLLHEGGHAFHFLWSHANEPLLFLRHAPIEFCEVASMSMELLALPHLDVFYEDAESQARAKRKMLEGIIRVFPWFAIIDAFQHWLYTHPGRSAEERRVQWLAILDRFQSDQVDWSGLDDERGWMWHRQLHLFHHPFYYVEYGIAQLGALQFWAHSRESPREALRAYREALSLGAGRPLPGLFEAAGLQFDFSRRTLEPLMQRLWDELESAGA